MTNENRIINNNNNENTSAKGMQAVKIHRFSHGALQAKEVDDLVATEQAVSIVVDEVGTFTILCTPTDIEAMAVGFVFAEGMIDTLDDVLDISVSQRDPSVIGIKVQEPSRVVPGRNLIIASSCGLCGSRNIARTLDGMSVSSRSLRVPARVLAEVLDYLESVQDVFAKTGGTHAAGVFDANGRTLSFAEDLGRHNAMDKAIGKCLLGRLLTEGCGISLSGRASFEMVSKAAQAQLELVASVSAPSSLAIEAAERAGITLCGFVRSGYANVYTHPERIEGCGSHDATDDRRKEVRES